MSRISFSTPTPIFLTCSFISHHTWLHNLLPWAINNSAFLIPQFHLWFSCRCRCLQTYKTSLSSKHTDASTGRQLHSGIRWTHPDSFGIFTKLNTSMCAADCRQGYTYKFHFTLTALSYTFFSKGEWIIQKNKSGASTSQVERLVLLSEPLHGWVIAVSSPQQRKSTAHGKGSGSAASPGYILQSMPLLAALSHLHLISIAVEWCAGAAQ